MLLNIKSFEYGATYGPFSWGCTITLFKSIQKIPTASIKLPSLFKGILACHWLGTILAIPGAHLDVKGKGWGNSHRDLHCVGNFSLIDDEYVKIVVCSGKRIGWIKRRFVSIEMQSY